MKIMHDSWRRASLNSFRILDAPTPAYISTKSEPLAKRNGTPASTDQHSVRNLVEWVGIVVGALVVAFTLAVNLARGQPIASVAAALVIAFVLYRFWVRAGRPRGIADIVSEAEHFEP